jgi:hypothetical protein
MFTQELHPLEESVPKKRNVRVWFVERFQKGSAAGISVHIHFILPRMAANDSAGLIVRL